LFACAGIYGTQQVSPQDEFTYSVIVGGIVLSIFMSIVTITKYLNLRKDSTVHNVEPSKRIVQFTFALTIQTLLLWAIVFLGLELAHCVDFCGGYKGGLATVVIGSVAWGFYSVYTFLESISVY
jgi:arginine exporter protein ArgO